MPLIWGFLESDQKDHSRLPNDNLVAVKFDDDAVFDAVTHRKNATRRTGRRALHGSAKLVGRRNVHTDELEIVEGWRNEWHPPR